jgi:hypothetical protein
LAYQSPASSIFLSEQTSHQPALLFSQNKPAPATSQPNMLCGPQSYSGKMLVMIKE